MRPRLRSGTIRVRLIRILALSLATVLVLLGFTMAGQLSAYQGSKTTVQEVDTELSVQALIHELQKERGLTVGLLGGDARFRALLPHQRRLTDAARSALSRKLNSGLRDAASVRTALVPLNTLASERATVDAGSAVRADLLAYFTNSIAALNTLNLGVDQTADPQLRRGLQALQALGDVKEYTGRERAVLSGVFAARKIQRSEYLIFMDDIAEKKAALAQYAAYATPAEQAALAADFHTPAAARAAADEAVALDSAGAKLDSRVDSVLWFTSMTTVINAIRATQIGVGADIDARAGQLRADAERNLLVIGLLALLVIALEVLLALGALRSVVGPLAQLARDAQDLASRRLPEAVERLRDGSGRDAEQAEPITVPKYSGTEIASVATALDQVQESALSLATGQAVLRRNTSDSLVNLARRNQNLVRRQLAFISKLERDEVDPEVLGNLFELDHLATRMRRNAESLLVLVGEATPRRRAEAVPVSDLIRAALAEVEDYRRVTLRRMDEAKIVGGAVAELAHLLAELIENALAFSPPDVEVEILGRAVGTGYLIAVIDHGVGMPAQQLARANAKLSGEERFDVAPTRFLGHYVVGHLAARLGVRVQVAESPTSGVTARIALPAALVTEPATTTTKPRKAAAAMTGTGGMTQRSATAGTAARVGRQATASAAERTAAALPSDAHEEHAERVRTTEQTGEMARVRMPAGSGGGGAESGDRTRNGLAKRSARAVAPTAYGKVRFAELPEGSRAPEDASALLTAFSAGHRRGVAARQGGEPSGNPADGGVPDRESPTHSAPEED